MADASRLPTVESAVSDEEGENVPQHVQRDEEAHGVHG